jgi:formylglycine-generating enzyme required for sulfatase activity
MATSEGTDRRSDKGSVFGGGTEREAEVLRRRLGMAREANAHLTAELAEAKRRLADLEKAARRPQAASEKAPADAAPVPDMSALENELATLRADLRERSELLAQRTVHCERLEQQFQEAMGGLDELRREHERRGESLREAREEAVVLRRALAELQRRGEGAEAPEPAADAGQPIQGDVPGPSGSGDARRAGGGLPLGAGVLVLALAVAVAVWRLWPDGGEVPDGPAATALGQQTYEPVPPSDPSLSPSAASREPAEVPRVRQVRDRLRGGGEGPLMIALPAGSFTMGNRVPLPGDDERPLRDVTLTGFLIGAYEVTYEEYDRFARSTGRGVPDDFGWGRGQRPVVGVSWQDANDYADWLSRETGRRYRLPSEAEWEYAARGGTDTPHWWGFEDGKGRAVCFDCGPSMRPGATAVVGSLVPNPFGLYDTAGNAMEWVADCYHPDYVGAPVDGSPRLDGDCEMRVARGGAFNKPSASMRSSSRARFAPETRIDMLGFRLAGDL